MITADGNNIPHKYTRLLKVSLSVIIMMLCVTFNIFSAEPTIPRQPNKYSTPLPAHPNETDSADSTRRLQRPGRYHLPAMRPEVVLIDSVVNDSLPTHLMATDSIAIDSVKHIASDSTIITPAIIPDSIKWSDEWTERKTAFVPNPTRAVWLSALFPGLGQIYNRRYWKLPIVVGAYMGLGYATSWNNRMLSDYTRAYRDIMDTDPATKSYMDFFPPTTKEESLDKSWLTNTLKSRKNYFRQNRDLCIICMVGVYLLAMVDAYVDASLSQFDLSPDLSMQVNPTLIQDSRERMPSVGVHWALCF